MFDKAMEKLKFDKRMIDYHRNNGGFDEAEYKTFLEKLPDLSSQVSKVKLTFDRSSDEGGGDGQNSSGW